MKDMTAFQKIKTGFWLGIGFIIPLLVSSLIGLIVSFASTPMMMEKAINNFEGDSEEKVLSGISQNSSRKDLDDQIKIVSYRESKIGNRLLILGVIANNGPQPVSSIQLQAELFNSEGQFVLECDEYINRKLKTQEKENFQIQCGCSDTPIPEYDSLNIRVLSANNY